MRDGPMTLAMCASLAAFLAITQTYAAVFEPRTPVSVHVWIGSDQPGFTFPELDPSGDWGLPALLARPNLGLALSGGGYRAAALALGWVRGLYLLGVLPHTRYISSNSGGSWLNGAMSYSGYPIGRFLGPYVPPANLTYDDLGAPSLLPPGSFGDTLAAKGIIADAIKGVLKDLFVPGRESFSGWTSAISEAFLDAYGLGLQNSSLTAAGTRGNVSARLAAAYPEVLLYTAMATPDRSFPIILGSIMQVETDQVFYPFEITPLYVGAPARNATVNPPLGAGFLETLGFNSPPPETPLAPIPPAVGLMQAPVSVTPAKLVPLGTYLSISSSFVAQGVRPSSSAGYALTGTERLNYWNPVNQSSGGVLSFSDGAGADNTAITPLLRRRVAAIIACVALIAPADKTPADWAVAQYDIAGLFGAVALNATSYEGMEEGITGVRPDVFNKALQVFPREGYDELHGALYGSLVQGQPGLHRASYPVLSNPSQGIVGGWTVEVLWILNSQARQWEQQLPNVTAAFLNLSRRDTGSDLHDYPHISTFTANYPPELVTLLSQQATWTVTQAATWLNEMLEVAAKLEGTTNATAAPTMKTSVGNITAALRAPHLSNVSAIAVNGTAIAASSGNITAAQAVLGQLVAAPPAVQLAGVLPEPSQRLETAENLTGGLSEAARQPRMSYTMTVPGVASGSLIVLQPEVGVAAARAGEVPGAEAARGHCWWLTLAMGTVMWLMACII